jgi:hypothetical protein
MKEVGKRKITTAANFDVWSTRWIIVLLIPGKEVTLEKIKDTSAQVSRADDSAIDHPTGECKLAFHRYLYTCLGSLCNSNP